MINRVAFLTLGCKVNTYDTNAMVSEFAKNNYEVVDFNDYADVYVINTCTVTHLSDKKSRQMIRRANKTNPNSVIVATGCYAQVAPEELLSLDEIDIIIGTDKRKQIVETIEEFKKGSNKISLVDNIMDITEFENLEADINLHKTRGYLKIQEGCNNYCAYCIIPYARGKIKSRKKNNILSEAEKLAKNNIKEIVLTGIHIASYGLDLDENIDLIDVIEEINNINGIERIRFSSVEPNFITINNLKRLSTLNKVCDFFHLSLQSGSDNTLKLMKRKYTTDEYRKAVNLIRDFYPNANITTDVIVGFSNESDDDFNESYNFCEEMKFGKIHVFPFSLKKGTYAENYGDNISSEIKKLRSEKLRRLSEKLELDFMQKNNNRIVDILFESEHNGKYEGYTTNYIKVSTNKNLTNQIVSGRIKLIDNKMVMSD